MVCGRFDVLFSKPDLVGRENAIEDLHRALGFGRPAVLTPVLTGQGGVGKTQLAVLYAYEKASDYPGGVFWINASDPGSIVRQLADYATQLGLKSEVGPHDDSDRQRALRWLGQFGQRKDVLLIVDNVDDVRLLNQDLPNLPNTRLRSLSCRLLVTSRLRNLPACTN